MRIAELKWKVEAMYRPFVDNPQSPIHNPQCC